MTLTVEESKPLPLQWFTFLSRTTLDWSCPRKRWWGYHALGRGLQTQATHVELLLGSCLHDALAAIATQWRDAGEADIDQIATAASAAVHDTFISTPAGGSGDGATYAREQASLVEGLLRGFYRHAWPNLMAQYPKIVAIEHDCVLPLSDNIQFVARPDLILADQDDNWYYIEYKSTSSKNTEWVNQWQTAVQLHSAVRAIQYTLGKAPAAVIVQGLYKGYHSYGKQSSPFCYSYYRQGTPPFSYPEVRYEYAAGFKRVPVWEREGGVKAWVDEMPAQQLGDQFPCTPPIFINDRLVDSFFQQRLLRETELREATKVINDPDMPEGMRNQFLDGFFPQRFDQCNPGFGKPCGFRELCFGGGGNPLDAGWIQREPHYGPEIEQLKREEELLNA